MSDVKNISPLLDGFTLGAPISEHHGVICCPAIKENTNKKYIVKMISIPATQTQFDALILAGAYKDPGDAMEYFREQGEGILQEADLLKKLSKIEGFLAYDGWQMEPITRRRLGYEVYLIGSYKRSLEKYIRKHAFTHLEAVNLGLDLCSALSVCRQSGAIYVDLKPSNIYVSENKEFRIGDLGFMPMDSLRYASLPERHFSPYTPPELLDPMTSMNLTVDTYAVGMILYQLYNDGLLPFTGSAPLESMPNPCHADYEMAEIIMKAIHPDPQQRWTEPKDLGKAIASYMQRNTVNDIPITPFIPLDVKPEDIVPITPPDASQEEIQEVDSETEPVSSIFEENIDQESDLIPSVEPPEEPPTEQETAADTEEEDTSSEDVISEIPEETVSPEETPADPDNSPSLPDSDPLPETEPETSEEEDSLADVSEEVAKIIYKANEIIAHEIPEEAVFPSEEEQTDPFAFAVDDSEILIDNYPVEPLMEDESENQTEKNKKRTKHYADPTRKKKWKKFLSGCFSLILVGGISVGGYWYYQNIYLLPIDSLSATGTQEAITVLVDTGIEESKLSVSCTDGHGKRQMQSVQGGKATFSKLNPNTQYTIEVDIDGFHKLTGQTTAVITTEASTQILSFQAIAGSEDGSVMLDFTVNGKDPDFWYIHYSAEGEEERTETVTGHSAMISGLTVGKVYTFTLDGGKNFGLSGETSVEYLASRLILAEDITVTSSNGTDITARWKTPGDVVVENWNVRFYDGYGFEELVTVTENQVMFSDLDLASKYTLEITASGMTQPSRISVTADPIIISDFQISETSPTEMTISWTYTGTAPEGGWQILYTVDGSGEQTISCDQPNAKIAPLIPGANYKLKLLAADNRTVYNNALDYQANPAVAYTANQFVSENVSFHLLRTPDDPKWHFETVSEKDYTNTFVVGDSASIVLNSSTSVYLPGYPTKTLFVFRDSYGNVLPELVTEISVIWKSIWLNADAKTGELNIPSLPEVPGAYVMELYFDGGFAAKFDITIAE